MTMTPVKFSAVVPQGAVKPLAQNVRSLATSYLNGKISNIDSFKTNAFILSSLIQVTSRVFVANRTARLTKDKPEGPYRYMEAVKTTFREIMGFTLNYMVLKAFQRIAADFFRNFFRVKSGINIPTTVFSGFFQRIFKFTPAKAKAVASPFPSLKTTVSAIREQVTAFMGKKPLPKVGSPNLDGFFENVTKPVPLKYDAIQYQKGERFINLVGKLAGKKNASPDEKLKAFFQYAPVLVGSIPSLILAGFMLERFSQTRAEDLARKITNMLGRSTATAKAPAIDPAATLSYAEPQTLFATNPAVNFNGNTTTQPAPQFAAHPWTARTAGLRGNGSGLPAAY